MMILDVDAKKYTWDAMRECLRTSITPSWGRSIRVVNNFAMRERSLSPRVARRSLLVWVFEYRSEENPGLARGLRWSLPSLEHPAISSSFYMQRASIVQASVELPRLAHCIWDRTSRHTVVSSIVTNCQARIAHSSAYSIFV